MSTPVIQQLPVLLGVGAGAIATYLTTSLAERARWRRERSSRWDQTRMQAYANYGDAMRKLSRLATRISVGRGFPHSIAPLAPDEDAIEALTDADGERGRAWESVLLLGDPETVGAAQEWAQAVWCLEWYARGLLTTIDQFEPAKRNADRARDRFYESARRDLGVIKGTLPDVPWPPNWMPEPTTSTSTANGELPGSE